MPDTDLSARVWPEDTGTGAADGNEDWDSAGYLAGMAAKDNTSDYVEAGLGITPDYATPAFDLAPGLAYIKYTGSVNIQLPTDDAATYSGSWDQGVTFAVDVDQQTAIALTDAAVNRVYLATDLSTNDGAYVRVDTEASPNVPTDPHITIAEIDTSADTTTELAREPDASFGDVSVSGKMDAASAEVESLTSALTTELGAVDPLVYYDYNSGEGALLDDVSRGGAVNYPDMGQPITTINGDPTDRHHFDPVHDYTIIELNESVDGSERSYLAYDSNVQGGEIRAYYSDDLTANWEPYSGNPILSDSDYRWPSTTYDGSTYHMFLFDRSDNAIKRYTSTDGVSFSFAEDIISNMTTSSANPSIWYFDDISYPGWYIYYKESSSTGISSLRVRHAESISGLASGSDHDLNVARRARAYGAPSVTYWRGDYWLAFEAHTPDIESSNWITKVKRASTPFFDDAESVPNNPIKTQGDACYEHRMGPNEDNLYGYISSEGRTDGWVIRSFEISEGDWPFGLSGQIENATWDYDAELDRQTLRFSGDGYVSTNIPRMSEYTIISISKADDVTTQQNDWALEYRTGVEARYNNGNYNLYHYDADGFESLSVDATSGEWAMHTARYDGNDVALLKGDSLADSASDVSPPRPSGDRKGPAAIGAKSPVDDENYLTGNATLFAAFPIALSDEYISQIYNSIF